MYSRFSLKTQGIICPSSETTLEKVFFTSAKIIGKKQVYTEKKCDHLKSFRYETNIFRLITGQGDLFKSLSEDEEDNLQHQQPPFPHYIFTPVSLLEVMHLCDLQTQ